MKQPKKQGNTDKSQDAAKEKREDVQRQDEAKKAYLSGNAGTGNNSSKK